MTRREGHVEQQVHVSVSEAMKRLRTEQIGLNFFLWTSELAYGFVRTSNDERLTNLESSAMTALGNIKSEASFPNTAGRLKYNGSIAQFLDQLSKKFAVVANATAVLWYSKLESYLHERLGTLAGHPEDSAWGPLPKTLCIYDLLHAAHPLRVSTLLRADLCRDVRNTMVHPGKGEIPDSVHHPAIASWKKRTEKHLLTAAVINGPRNDKGWGCANPARELHEAAEQVVGQVANHLKDTKAEGKQVTASFFYALFSFANYDSLAFEVEEALMPGSGAKFTIKRQERMVRRKELILLDPIYDTPPRPPNASGGDGTAV